MMHIAKSCEYQLVDKSEIISTDKRGGGEQRAKIFKLGGRKRKIILYLSEHIYRLFRFKYSPTPPPLLNTPSV